MVTDGLHLDETIRALRHSLATCGFALLSPFVGGRERVLALARALGPLFVPGDIDPVVRLIESSPAEGASYLAPFDQADAIGWHNDFSTHEHRAVVSLAYLERSGPQGPEHGAWRVASGDDVIASLRSTAERVAVVELLLTEGGPTLQLHGRRRARHVSRPREPRPRAGPARAPLLRARAARRRAHGEIPPRIEHAIAAVERAADRVGETLLAPAASLLVTHNWHALHDRLAQTVSGALPLRRSLLCFVGSIDREPVDHAMPPGT